MSDIRERKQARGMRAVKIFALLSSPDPITDAELESIAQQAIDDTDLDINECEITLVELPEIAS